MSEKLKEPQQEHSITHHPLPRKLNPPTPEQAHLYLAFHWKTLKGQSSFKMTVLYMGLSAHMCVRTSVTEYMLTVTVVFSKLISINLFSDYSADDSSMSMHVTTVNCRSVVNKRANLETSTNYIKSGVICGCISWLNKNIKSSEVVRDYYTAYQKDCNTAGGGLVLIEAHILRWTKPQRRLWNCEGQNTTPKQK